MKELRVINSENSHNQSLPKKKEKKKWFSLFLVFALAIIVYLIVNLCMSFSNSYSVYTVSRGEYEDTITVKGCLFREQTLINAPVSGFLDCNAAENTRVSVGSEAAVIYNKELDNEISAKIRKIDSEISSLNKNKIKDTSYSYNSSKSNQHFADKIKQAVSYGYSKDFSGITEVSASIINDIRRKGVSDNTKDKENVDNAVLSELKAQRDKIIAENNIQSTPLIAEVSGVFSSKIDGLEESLGIDKLTGLKPSYINEIYNKNISNETSVEAGKPVCKIINNFEWYLAASIPTEKAALISVGQDVKLRFFDITNNTITGEVTYISPDENGETAIVIKSNRYVDSIYTLSKASVDIIKNQYSGLKIPTDGIRVSDNKTGVYVLRRGIAKFVNVDVIYSDGKWAIIREGADGTDGIKLYDELILNARNLYDGKIMK